jgi:hypothetical protein
MVLFGRYFGGIGKCEMRNPMTEIKCSDCGSSVEIDGAEICNACFEKFAVDRISRVMSRPNRVETEPSEECVRQLQNVLQLAWDEYTTDIGCFPEDYELGGRGETLRRPDFNENFVRFVARELVAADLALKEKYDRLEKALQEMTESRDMWKKAATFTVGPEDRK